MEQKVKRRKLDERFNSKLLFFKAIVDDLFILIFVFHSLYFIYVCFLFQEDYAFVGYSINKAFRHLGINFIHIFDQSPILFFPPSIFSSRSM